MKTMSAPECNAKRIGNIGAIVNPRREMMAVDINNSKRTILRAHKNV